MPTPVRDGSVVPVLHPKEFDDGGVTGLVASVPQHGHLLHGDADAPFKTARYTALALFLLGFAIPDNPTIPIPGFPRSELNPDSFWTCAWCGPGTAHFGLDMVYDRGTPVIAATPGFVIYKGWHNYAGQVVVVLGPKWRLHYYGHLDDYRTRFGAYVSRGQVIGILGNTGPSDLPHLHYAIITLVPYPWKVDTGKLGYLKMFFLNPYEALAKRH